MIGDPPAAAPPLLAWGETLFLCLLLPALGWWTRPQDPFFVAAHFPWILLAPLLSALRYGFAHGFISALILIALITLGWRTGLVPDGFPAPLVVGLLLVGMIAGEFADIYRRRIEQQRVVNDYQRMRLDEFTRNYHLLKISHDRLEQRLAAGTHSLRGALLDLRRRLAGQEFGDNPVKEVAQEIIGIFASFGWVQVAGLFEVRDRHLAPAPVATLGELRPVDPFDPLVRHALLEGELVSLREELLATDSAGQSLIAAVPLVDVQRHPWGLLVIQEMPFIALQQENLRLLAVLGGHIADILSTSQGTLDEKSPEARKFLNYLQRSLHDYQVHDLPALVLVIRFPARHPQLDRLVELFLGQVRGLDHPWRLDARGRPDLLFLLMPLTAEHEAEAYRQRMDRLLKESFGSDLREIGIQMLPLPLGKKDSVKDILERIYEAAGIHDDSSADR